MLEWNIQILLLCFFVPLWLVIILGGIGALERRIDICELQNNTFADISDFMKYLKEDGKINFYPEGLVESAYTIAGGNLVG